MNEQEKKEYSKVMQLLTASWINYPMYIVTKLGIPDILSDNPMNIDELAEITKSYRDYLYRIMRALASIGFFHEDENSRFAVTPMGELLKKDKIQPIVLMFLSEWHNHAWEKLFNSVQTGDIAFESALGKPCFEWFKENPDEADVFNKANQIKAVASHTESANVYDFSQLKSLVDIGGGYGGLLIHILNIYPNLKGIIADLPYMKNEVIDQISINGLNERCSFTECNFFEKIPEGNDCYILSNILHDWDDRKCEIILDKCNAAMQSNSKLLIIESIIPERNEFSIAKLLDLEVLVMGGGKERTETEYRDLLNKAGFDLLKIFDTKENISILECTKMK